MSAPDAFPQNCGFYPYVGHLHDPQTIPNNYDIINLVTTMVPAVTPAALQTYYPFLMPYTPIFPGFWRTTMEFTEVFYPYGYYCYRTFTYYPPGRYYYSHS